MEAGLKKELPQEGTGSAGESLPEKSGCPTYSGGGKEVPTLGNTVAAMSAPTVNPTHTAAALSAPTTTLDLTALKDAMPGSTPKSEPLWSVHVKKRKAKTPKPPHSSTPEAPKTGKTLTSKQRRSRARAEKRRARRQEAKGSKQPSKAAEETSRVHEVPTGTLPIHGAGVSLAAGKADAQGSTRVGQPTSSDNRRVGRKAGAGSKQPSQVAEAPVRTHDAPAGARPNVAGASLATGPVGAPGATLGGQPPGSDLALRPRGNRGGAKRNRPDDTISPKVNTKRVRTVTTTGRASYAEAMMDNNLSLAIMTEPAYDLTEEQGAKVLEELEKVMDREIFSPSASASSGCRAPAFRGKAFVSGGVLKFWCENLHTADWLRAAVRGLPSPRENTRLVVRQQSEVPRKVKASLYLPSFTDGSVDTLRVRLRSQNCDWYDVDSWSIYHAEQQEGKEGIFLVLGIPLKEAKKIQERGRRVAYKLGSTYIRFAEDPAATPPTAESTAGVPTDLPNPAQTSGEPSNGLGKPGDTPDCVVRHSSPRKIDARPPLTWADAALEMEQPKARMDWWSRGNTDDEEELLKGSDGSVSSPARDN